MGGCGHAGNHRDAGANRFLHHLEAAPAGEQGGPRLGQTPGQEQPADRLVQGIVAAYVLTKGEHLPICVEQRRGMGCPRLPEVPLLGLHGPAHRQQALQRYHIRRQITGQMGDHLGNQVAAAQATTGGDGESPLGLPTLRFGKLPGASDGNPVRALLIAVRNGADVGGRIHQAFAQAESRHQVDIIAWGAHDGGIGLAIHKDLQRLLHDEGGLLGSERAFAETPYSRSDGGVVSGQRYGSVRLGSTSPPSPLGCSR